VDLGGSVEFEVLSQRTLEVAEENNE